MPELQQFQPVRRYMETTQGLTQMDQDRRLGELRIQGQQRRNTLMDIERQGRLREMQESLYQDIAAGAAYADTPEKWNKVIDMFAKTFPEAEQYRDNFDQRDVFIRLGHPQTRPAALQEFEYLLEAAGEDKDGMLRKNAALYALGQRSRPTERITLAEDKGLARDVAMTQSDIEGAKAGAKATATLEAQQRLKPQVESAVQRAVDQARSEADIAEKDRSNASALAIYETAMGGLFTALGNTDTGPIAGRLPAMTANQQIAEGAIAAMAPVLKQLFRVAGEGVFTDRDQQLLLDMVPKRTDHPEAIVAKMQNIDAIVRAKLGQTEQAANPADGDLQSLSDGATATNPETGERIIFRGGQWQKM